MSAGGSTEVPSTEATDNKLFERATIKVKAFDTYSVIAAMTLSCTVGMFSSADPTVGGVMQQITTIITLFSVAVSVLSGTYTTLVFGLISLYSKTALGMQNDNRFVEFSKATTKYRQEGFYSFLVCVGSFGVAFCLSLITRLSAWPVIQVMVTCATVVACYRLARSLSEVMDLASTLVFATQEITQTVSMNVDVHKILAKCTKAVKDRTEATVEGEGGILRRTKRRTSSCPAVQLTEALNEGKLD